MNNYEQVTQEVRDAFEALCKRRVEAAVKAERNSWPAEMEAMERQVNILTDALAQEREACAKMVDHILKEGGGTYGDSIRARGQA